MVIDEQRLAELGVDLGVVFGSHARAQAGPGSDVDVGVLFSSPPPDLGAIEEFRLRAHKHYMDTAKFRRLQAEALDERYG